MTRVQLEYELLKPINQELMDQIARAHGVYGIIRVSLAPSMDRLTVEYDASRLSPVDVETTLQKMGIPVVLSV
jgi:allophanate hydrolase subunit 1